MLSYSCQTVDSMLSIFHRPIEKSTNGRIIVISSIWGETGTSMETIYSAMKSAQMICKGPQSRASIDECHVNAIAPGFVSGRMAKAFGDEDKAVILSELPQQE